MLKHLVPPPSPCSGVHRYVSPSRESARLLVRSLLNLRLACNGGGGNEGESIGLPGAGVIDSMMFDFNFWFGSESEMSGAGDGAGDGGGNGDGGDDDDNIIKNHLALELLPALSVLCRLEGASVLQVSAGAGHQQKSNQSISQSINHVVPLATTH